MPVWVISSRRSSGRHAFRDKLSALGYELGDNALEDAFRRFKDLADKKKHIFDEDIVAHVPPSAKHFDHSGNFGRTADVSVEPVWPGIGDAHAQ